MSAIAILEIGMAAVGAGTVHPYLDETGAHYSGRYGDWAYFWTDDSFKSGERAAESALARV